MEKPPHIRPAPEVIALAAECFAEDIPIARVIERAGISWSTWTRAKRCGQRPRKSTMDKMLATLADLVEERRAEERA